MMFPIDIFVYNVLCILETGLSMLHRHAVILLHKHTYHSSGSFSSLSEAHLASPSSKVLNWCITFGSVSWVTTKELVPLPHMLTMSLLQPASAKRCSDRFFIHVCVYVCVFVYVCVCVCVCVYIYAVEFGGLAAKG